MNSNVTRNRATPRKQSERAPNKGGSNRFFNIVIAVLAIVAAAVILWQMFSPGEQSDTPTGSTFTRFEGTVCIDAGHGYSDTGAQSELLGSPSEKDINLSIALKLKAELEKRGCTVIMTRENDDMSQGIGEDDTYTLSLEERCAIANSANDISAFVSIHCDSYPASSEVGGTRVYFQSGHSTGIANMAQSICNGISERLDGRSARPFPMHGDDTYYVVKHVTAPAVLIETGFITNPTDASLLLSEDWQAHFAEAVAEGLTSYLANAYVAA